MKCNECGIDFIRGRNKKQKYCTTVCYKKAKLKRYNKKYNYKLSKIQKNCIKCGLWIERGRRNQKFCNTKCASEARKVFLDIPSCLENASRKIDKNIGYVRVYAPMHPEANTWGYVYEHRIIAEQMIRRRLKKDEIVHHKNGKRCRLPNMLLV